jgi:hypothetical protein
MTLTFARHFIAPLFLFPFGWLAIKRNMRPYRDSIFRLTMSGV